MANKIIITTAMEVPGKKVVEILIESGQVEKVYE